MYNKSEFERLSEYAEKSEKPLVLTPHLIKNWGKILDTSYKAYEQHLTDWSSNTSPKYKPMPNVLENVLPPDSNYCKPYHAQAIDILDKAESFLRNKGYKNEDLEYYDCGQEAIVFKIKNIPDLLIKISNYKAVPMSPLRFGSFKSENIQSEDLKHTKTLSVALVPYMDYSVGSLKIPDPNSEMRSPSLPPELIEKYKHINMDSIDKIHDLLAAKGINFTDRKPINVRCHADLPNMCFITDKRAIDQNGDEQNHKRPLTENEKEILEACEEVQMAIRDALIKKYGRLETAFQKVAEASHGTLKQHTNGH